MLRKITQRTGQNFIPEVRKKQATKDTSVQLAHKDTGTVHEQYFCGADALRYQSLSQILNSDRDGRWTGFCTEELVC